MTVQPVRFNVVKREKFGENFPGVRHTRLFSEYEFLFRITEECLVLNFQDFSPIVVSEGNPLFLPTTDLFVAFLAIFLAEQNSMSCLGAQLTFHFEHKTPAGPSLRDMNLSGIINICTDD